MMRLIDADALWKAITTRFDECEEYLEILESMPTIEERKLGRWLRSGSDLFPFECDQCSETNERKTPWCPHCGCKMEVEHEP